MKKSDLSVVTPKASPPPMKVVITLTPDGILNTNSNITHPVMKLGLMVLGLLQQAELTLHPEDRKMVTPFTGPLPPLPQKKD